MSQVIYMNLKLTLIKTTLRLFGKKIFNNILLQCESSKTYPLFCEEVYGRNLYQANMVDEEQLQQLVALIKEKKPKNILDLGCGSGHTTEYLSDQIPESFFLGIDFADKIVEYDKSRTN